MDNGWIKLHRKIKWWEWYKDNNTKSLFFHLLVEANHNPQKWRGHLIDNGQAVVGRKQLSKDLGISEQSIRTSIKRLKSTSEITIKSTNKFSIITIVNWEQYQGKPQKSTSKPTSTLTINQPATNQQLTTNKNNKNNKNVKKLIIAGKPANRINQLMNLFYKINPTINWGNKTQRKALDDIVKKLGFEKSERTIKYALKVQGELYAPTITTPLQLKNKLGDLLVYWKKNNTGRTIKV